MTPLFKHSTIYNVECSTAVCYLAVDLLICSEIRFASCYTADVPTATALVPAAHLLQVRLIVAAQQHCSHLPDYTATNMQDGTEGTAGWKGDNLNL